MPEEEKEGIIIQLPTEKERQSLGGPIYEPPIFSPPKPTTEELPPDRFKFYDFLLLLGVFIFATASVLLTQRGVGFSWDEAYYYEPAKKSVAWLQVFFSNPREAIKETVINESFAEISELPAVSKFLLGLSQQFFSNILGKIQAMRVSPALAFALSLLLLYLIAFQLGGRVVGIAGVLLYWLMPHPFGHAHIATTESLANFIILLTVWFFLKSITNQGTFFSLLTGLVAGLALATRINCLLIFPILIVVGYLWWREKSIHSLFYLTVLAPIVMIIVSPWFWHDIIRRILEYLTFFATHQATAVYYLGTRYIPGGTSVPWHYPWLLTAITLPEATLFFIILGFAFALAIFFSPSTPSLRKGLITLILALALFPMLIASLPGTPKYDGVRLFLPAFPFLAILGGLGIRRLSQSLSTLFNALKTPSRRTINYFAAALIILTSVNGLWAIISYYPFHLSYFNQLIGGIDGASKKGMEITYWGEAVNEEVIDYLNKNLPAGTRLKLLALHEKVFEYLQEWQILRRDIIIDSPPPYDYHLLLIRRGFFARPERYLYDSWPPLKAFTFKNVPLVILYKTGASFEAEWRKLKP